MTKRSKGLNWKALPALEAEICSTKPPVMPVASKTSWRFFSTLCDMCLSCSRKEMCHLWFGFKSGKLAVRTLFFGCRFTLNFVFYFK